MSLKDKLIRGFKFLFKKDMSDKQHDNNELLPSDRLEYVLGFAFNPELNKVVLIKKKRPLNQKGLLNGVGGKIVNDESFKIAMCREFAEETSYLSNIDDWEYVAKMTVNGYNIYCFKTIIHDYTKVVTWTDEFVNWYDVDKLEYKDLVHGAKYVIDICLKR